MRQCLAIFVLLLLVVPCVAHADKTAQSVCYSNLKEIDAVVHLWAQENHLSDTNSYTLGDGAINRYLFRSSMVICPSGGTYLAGKTVADSPRCTHHGTLEEMRNEYIMARRRHNGIQIGSGIAAALLAGLVLRGLQSFGRISESAKQMLGSSLLLLLGVLVWMIPQDTLRPTFGIVHPILNVPTAVLFCYGLIVAVKAMSGGRRISTFVLGGISVVFVFLLSLILYSWLR
jgi:hypothetical protein